MASNPITTLYSHVELIFYFRVRSYLEQHMFQTLSLIT